MLQALTYQIKKRFAPLNLPFYFLVSLPVVLILHLLGMDAELSDKGIALCLGVIGLFQAARWLCARNKAAFPLPPFLLPLSFIMVFPGSKSLFIGLFFIMIRLILVRVGYFGNLGGKSRSYLVASLGYDLQLQRTQLELNLATFVIVGTVLLRVLNYFAGASSFFSLVTLTLFGVTHAMMLILNEKEQRVSL